MQDLTDKHIDMLLALDDAHRTKENARLIAAARNNLRPLCEEVKRLRAEVIQLGSGTRKSVRTIFTDDGPIVTVTDRMED